MPRITYLGQSGFYLETSDCKFLIDPKDCIRISLKNLQSIRFDVKCIIPKIGEPLKGYK